MVKTEYGGLRNLCADDRGLVSGNEGLEMFSLNLATTRLDQSQPHAMGAE